MQKYFFQSNSTSLKQELLYAECFYITFNCHKKTMPMFLESIFLVSFEAFDIYKRTDFDLYYQIIE